jgi:hypothetical protein
MARKADRAGDYARIALASIRLFNGAAALFVPATLARRLGVDPEPHARMGSTSEPGAYGARWPKVKASMPLGTRLGKGRGRGRQHRGGLFAR